MTNSGTLYIVGTPIGNLEDMTLRAMRILTSVEVIICEDTRTSRTLLEVLKTRYFKESPSGKHPLLVRSDEHTQLKMIPKVFTWLDSGVSVALTTDAGMPTISDPGWKVVDAVRDAGYPIEVVPGPTALTAALATSGFEASKVWFIGFLPKKNHHRQQVYTEISRQLDEEISTAIVFYESPNRLKESLIELKTHRLVASSPHRLKVAVCSELTKLHEKVIRGTVDEVLENLPSDIKGEWVVVVGK